MALPKATCTLACNSHPQAWCGSGGGAGVQQRWRCPALALALAAPPTITLPGQRAAAHRLGVLPCAARERPPEPPSSRSCAAAYHIPHDAAVMRACASCSAAGTGGRVNRLGASTLSNQEGSTAHTCTQCCSLSGRIPPQGAMQSHPARPGRCGRRRRLALAHAPAGLQRRARPAAGPGLQKAPHRVPLCAPCTTYLTLARACIQRPAATSRVPGQTK